uniref:Uncharacterized protein n=1 Tax=Phlebotomus papatasi TaxID=29031 RepID=A0A1B0D7C6_PHLPP
MNFSGTSAVGKTCSEGFISLCHCRGTVGLVHRHCLEKWLNESGKTECELCHFRYQTASTLRL